jgi:hypothetical protein
MTDSIDHSTRWERIADALVYIDGTFPVEAVFEARDHWPEVREQFLDELTRAVADPYNAFEEENALPIYAMFLAAEKRDAAFAPAILDLMKLPPELIDLLLGESALTESVGRCLASVWHGDDDAIRELARDKGRDDFVRVAAAEAIVVRAIEGDADMDSVSALVFSILQDSAVLPPPAMVSARGKSDRNAYDPFFNMLLSTLTDLGACQYWPQIEQWDRDGLIDPMHEKLESLRETIFSSREVRLERMFKPHYVRDTVAEMSWWACFHEPEPPETYIRAQAKIGRNDPCPCNSGKKFKKCCGANL